jgi:TfoX/Sxy family transcriptional regulator of competence genes
MGAGRAPVQRLTAKVEDSEPWPGLACWSLGEPIMKKAARTKRTKKQRAVTEIDPSFVPVVKAFATERGVTGGMMMASYGLKVNGKIFAMLVKGQFVAKLPKHRVDELVSGGHGDRFEPGHGRVMKEWISVPPGEANWIELAREAYHFVKEGKA